MSKANKQKEENVAETVPPVRHAPATESLSPTIIKEREEMFLRLGFSQTVAIKLVDDKGIDFPQILANLSDEDIPTICNVINRSSRLVSEKTPDRGNKISILATKNLKLTAFMFKTMEHCFKDYKIRCVNSTSVL